MFFALIMPIIGFASIEYPLNLSQKPQPILQAQNGFRDAYNIEFSMDGTICLIGNTLWQVKGWKKLREFSGASSAAYSLSPNQKNVYTSQGQNTYVEWNASTGNSVYSFSLKEDDFETGFHASPIGENLFVTYVNGKLLVRSKQSNRIVSTLKDTAEGEPKLPMLTLVGRPGKNQLLYCYDATPKPRVITPLPQYSDYEKKRKVAASTPILIDVERPTQFTELKSHSEPVFHLEFSRDGSKVLTASFDGTVKIWNADNGKPLQTIQCEKNVNAARFLVDDSILIIENDWQDSRTIRDGITTKVNGITNAVDGLSFSTQLPNCRINPDGSEFLILNQNYLVAYNMDPKKSRWILDSSTVSPLGASIVQGRVSVDFKDLYQYRLNFPIQQFEQPFYENIARTSHTFNSPSLSEDGEILVGLDTKMRLIGLDSRSGIVLFQVSDPDGYGFVYSQISKNGKNVVTKNANGVVTLWRLEGNKLMTISRVNVHLSQVNFSDDCRIMARNRWDGLEIFDLGENKQIDLINLNSRGAFKLNCDGTLLALTASEESTNFIAFYNVVSKQIQSKILIDSGRMPFISDLYWSPNSETIYAAWSQNSSFQSNQGTLTAFDIGSQTETWSRQTDYAGEPLQIAPNGDVLIQRLVIPGSWMEVYDGKTGLLKRRAMARSGALFYGRDGWIVDFHDFAPPHILDENFNVRGTLVPHNPPFWPADSTQSRMIQWGERPEIHYYSLETGEEIIGPSLPLKGNFYPGAFGANSYVSEVFTGALDRALAVIDLKNFEPRIILSSNIKNFSQKRESSYHQVLSQSGDLLILSYSGGTPIAWDTKTNRILQEFEHPTDMPEPTEFSQLVASRNERFLVAMMPSAQKLVIWNIKTGKYERSIALEPNEVSQYYVSSNFIVTQLRLINLESGKEISRHTIPGLKNEFLYTTVASLVKDDLIAVVQGGIGMFASTPMTTKLYSLPNYEVIGQLELPSGVNSLGSFSSSQDGSRISATDGKQVYVWDLDSKKVVFAAPAHIATMDLEGKYVVTQLRPEYNLENFSTVFADLWIRDAKSGKRMVQIKVPGGRFERPVWTKNDARVIGTGHGSIFIVDSNSGQVLKTITEPHRKFFAVFVLPNQQIIAIANDGSTALFNAEGQFLASIYPFVSEISQGMKHSWVVVDAEGRFDTSGFLQDAQLQWIVPELPFETFPLETFAREYFEPGLLGKIMRQEPRKNVRDVSELNLSEPKMSMDVSIEGDYALIGVSVKPGTPLDPQRVPGMPHDLRITIDNRVVDSVAGELPLQNGEYKGDFKVRLPKNSWNPKFKIGAYCFNQDRVKAQGVTQEIQTEIESRMGKAYIISIGIDRYDRESLNLKCASNDAELVIKALRNSITGTSKIITIPIISNSEQNFATKENLKSVFDYLAGRESDISWIPNSQDIEAATPEDIIIVTWSGHGLFSPISEFHLVPSSILATGSMSSTEVLKSCISTSELELWFSDLRFKEMLFAIDACYSGAALGTGEFLPGPLGNRGLGQLAYDKGIRILASTQSDNVALESNSLGYGLLTYAFFKEGILDNLAGKVDRAATLNELTQFAAKRVPALYGELKSGSLKAAYGLKGDNESDTGSKLHQKPALYDYTGSDLTFLRRTR